MKGVVQSGGRAVAESSAPTAAGSGLPLRNVAASAYARLHERFLRLAGGEAECACEAALTMLLAPGLSVLDAGCGPAPVARRLLAREPGIRLTLVDRDMRMLSRVGDMPAAPVRASMTQLPFRDDIFDLSFAFWSLEMLDDPVGGVANLVRVTRPGGWIAITYCAQRHGVDWIDRLHACAIRLRRSGRFLDPLRVDEALCRAGAQDIVRLHCRGPACAVLARSGP